jgi:hypothetical protein
MASPRPERDWKVQHEALERPKASSMALRQSVVPTDTQFGDLNRLLSTELGIWPGLTSGTVRFSERLYGEIE